MSKVVLFQASDMDARLQMPKTSSSSCASSSDTLMANSAAKDILAFAKSRTNNVPLYMPDIEEFWEDERKALEETLAAESDDPDDSGQSDEYDEYESFLEYIYDELASLGI